MQKKLPGVFPGKVKKNSGNNKQIFYSEKEQKDIPTIQENKIEVPKYKYEKNINQKINEIFRSKSYIYKADVEIVLKDETVVKRVVGKNSKHLITMDNELIPISDILDIKLKQD